MQTITSQLVTDKVVILRLDLNVPLTDDHTGIEEDTKIKAALPTIQEILKGAPKQIHILTHLGRPGGQTVHNLSTKVLLKPLMDYLNANVEYVSDFIPTQAQIQLHENVRFHPGEKKCTPEAVQVLKNLGGDIFVNDAFAVSHRAHASVVGLADTLPCYAGLNMAKEIEYMQPLRTKDKQKGLTVIIGGVKLETKIPVLEHFAVIADHVLIGGGVANTFLATRGVDVKKSFYEPAHQDLCLQILKTMQSHNTTLHIPTDAVCGAELNSETSRTVAVTDIPENMQILDMGPDTNATYDTIIQDSTTIIWNGPLGVFENPVFADGTKSLLKALQKTPATTIVGGGESLDALQRFGVPHSSLNHVSTGGGAMLEYLSGKDLPGIQILG